MFIFVQFFLLKAHFFPQHKKIVFPPQGKFVIHSFSNFPSPIFYELTLLFGCIALNHNKNKI